MQNPSFLFYNGPSNPENIRPDTERCFFMTKLYKWVEIRNGRYKLVPSTDPRPEVKLKSRKGAPNIQYTPPWKVHEQGMYIGTPKEQLDSASKFNDEREHQVKTDPKAAKWEKSRRDWFAKQKHSWRQKEMQKLKEQGI